MQIKKKNRILIALLSLLLLMISVLFSGCANVDYTTVKLRDGSINEMLATTIDEAKIQEKSQSVAVLKNSVQKMAVEILTEKLTEYTKTITKYVKYYQNAGNVELANAYAELLMGVDIKQPSWKDDVFYLSIDFANITSYSLFYNLTEKNFVEEKRTENFFIEKIYYVGNLGYNLNSGLVSLVYNEFQLNFPELLDENVTLSYSYLPPSTRYHSDADKVTMTADGKLHTWEIKDGDLDREIHFYLILANRASWFIVALLISEITAIILLLIATISALIRHKKNKQKIKENI